MAGLVSEDVPQAPNESLQFGQATENARLQHEVASQSGGGQPPGGPPSQAPPPPPSAPPSPPVQASPGFPEDKGVPRAPDGRLDTGTLFSNVSTVNNWRVNADTWSKHPAAGTYLKFLGKHSKADIGGK